MLRNKLVRSDGSLIDSSVIISCEFTEEVNSGTNLTVGDVTASELSVEIRDTDVIQQGEVLEYYIVEDGVETKIGVFNAEKPTVATRTSMRFSAYDNIIKTEKQFSDWLWDNQGLFPMPLSTLVAYACSYCGMGLVSSDFPNANLSVEAFYADDITCRQILSWAAAIAGRFVRANTEGNLEFAWYADGATTAVTPSKTDSGASVSVSDDGDGNVAIQSENLSLTDDGKGNINLLADGLTGITGYDGVSLISDPPIPFLRDKLSYESYSTDLITRVQIKRSEDDIGTIFPADATGNCFTISENMILGAMNQSDVLTVAASLYNQLRSVTYVPFSVTVPRTIRVRAGSRIGITESGGTTFETYVMRVTVAPGGTTLSTTGDKSYESNVAVSSEKYSNLAGKVLTISKTVDGLVVENKDLAGKVSGLEMTTESIRTYVEESFVSGDDFEKYKSEVTQTSKDITERFDSLDKYKNETSAFIKTGLLYETEDNQPVYGMEIGQETKNANGEDVFNKYARFTADKLSFFDQGGNEVSQIGDKKMSVTNIEVTGSQDGDSEDRGTFKQGKFVRITQANGGIVTKWVGGD